MKITSLEEITQVCRGREFGLFNEQVLKSRRSVSIVKKKSGDPKKFRARSNSSQLNCGRCGSNAHDRGEEGRAFNQKCFLCEKLKTKSTHYHVECRSTYEKLYK
uniref:RETRotransposonlike family member (Retr1)like [Saccoglossus kowalevskii] n=1 Tax=Lepeophtheirus salmonis TaxID=72036 RepID=A0A0K2URY8_LEPSM